MKSDPVLDGLRGRDFFAPIKVHGSFFSYINDSLTPAFLLIRQVNRPQKGFLARLFYSFFKLTSNRA